MHLKNLRYKQRSPTLTTAIFAFMKLKLVFLCSVIIITIITTIGFLPRHLFTSQQSSPSFFHNANAAAAKGEYTQAIDYYKKALGLNASASIHYNLANTYYLNNQIGKAIVHYEKALLIHPHFSQARHNLKQLRKQTQLESDPKSEWFYLTRLLPSNLWLLLLTLTVWIGITGSSLIYFYKVKNKGIFIFLTLCTLVHLLSLLALAQSHYQSKYAVILEKDLHLQVAPTMSSPKLQPLQEGEIILTQKYYRDYFLVKRLSGETGWIPKMYVEKISKERK